MTLTDAGIIAVILIMIFATRKRFDLAADGFEFMQKQIAELKREVEDFRRQIDVRK